MELIDVLRFTPMGTTIGIVKAKDGLTGEIKFYIGKGEGIDEDLDIASILALGTKFKKETLLAFLNK